MALSEVSHDLIASSQRGDEGAVEELIRQVSPDLYRILFSMLRDHDDTDEVLQETLIRVFRHIGSLKDVRRFPAWIMRVAVNQAQTFRVRKNRTRLYEMEEGRDVPNDAVVLNGTPPGDPRQRLIQEQMRDEILSAMDSLPERQRMSTVLFELEGLSIREIAEALQCSEGAVKFNIHEGRKKLKRRLMHMVRDWKSHRRDGSVAEPAVESSAG